MKIVRNSTISRVLDLVMKDRNPQDKLQEPLLDDNDPLWQLLGKSPRPEPDDWFVVRTLARCRNTGLGMEGIDFRTIWRWALGGGLSVCLAIVLLVPHNRSEAVVPEQQKNVQEAFEIMASMDNSASDSASSSSTSPTSTWQDSSL
jgi:hypothetical protein